MEKTSLDTYVKFNTLYNISKNLGLNFSIMQAIKAIGDVLVFVCKHEI